MNFKNLQTKIEKLATEIGMEFFKKLLTSTAEVIIAESGAALTAPEPKQLNEKPKAAKAATKPVAAEPEDAEIVEETPVAETPVAEPGKRLRSTDAEMVIKLTEQLKAGKDVKAQLDKYVAKVKAAGKVIPPTVTVVEPVAEKPVAVKAAPKAKAAPAPVADVEEKVVAAIKTAKAPATKAAVWNGKVGILAVKVGDIVMITSEDFEGISEDNTVRCKVIAVREGAVEIQVPSTPDGEVTNDGDFSAEAERGVNVDWVAIKADGSNIRFAKKEAKAEEAPKKAGKFAKKGSL